MNHGAKHFFSILSLFTLCGCAATPVVPDQRDAQVLQALGNHVWADPEFDMIRIPTNGAIVVLHSRTPAKTGFLMQHQMRSDIAPRTLPSDAERDLRQRNTPRDANPDSYDAVAACFTNLTFTASNLMVADLTDKMGQRGYVAFEKVHPKARGWMEAYLPGYSKDGNQAIVRAGVGPSPHGAMLTALLEKNSGKWEVKWHHIAWYF